MKNLETASWFVCRDNNGQFRQFNIFSHGGFVDDVKKLSGEQDREVFNYELNRILRYYFWGRCEYELVVKQLIGDEEKKIDVYSQIALNFDRFSDYIWGLTHICNENANASKAKNRLGIYDVTADYRENNPHKPHYYIRAESKQKAKKKMMESLSHMKIYNIERLTDEEERKVLLNPDKHILFENM